ncbi:hypothetical protein [Phaeobacter inhibens]|uniref:hypothetical protein n=1 Tax=Phaeobacter inhibens TaxID=221822 RepID=UPI00076BB5DE|nr:hypothetical protein [Phaeobacter inhibens]KXF92281.1 hypothetical protein AT574_02890 [Phaeobacter inhibens]WHP66871.1 hypothetical protein QMZ01_09885 [Phaeobacter inhibens]
MDRLVQTSNQSVVAAYENKIAVLEHDKALLSEKATQALPGQRSYEEKLELAVKFITSPWKLWASNNIKLRRLVLKLAFADRLIYDRNKGARTPEFTLPFKALEGVMSSNLNNGAGEGT